MKCFSDYIVNTKQLLANLKSLPNKNICAMVKANAYGVGIKTVCKTLKNYVKFFGVASLQEGLEIRKFDKQTPILVVGKISDFLTAIKNNISITIENPTELIRIIKEIKIINNKLNNKNNKLNINKIINKLNKNKINIHLKINSGMNRLGISDLNIFKKIIKIIKNNKIINLEGIFTHFSTPNIDKKYYLKQLYFFYKFIDLIPKDLSPIIHLGGGDVLDNCLNDKGQLLSQYKNYMFRVGLKLYTTPKSIIKITSRITKIFTIRPGQRLGYSNGFIAKKKMKIGIIPLGYGDGIPRCLSNIAYIKISKSFCKIVGNICMDMMFVDISKLKNIKPFQKITILQSPADFSSKANTIDYEILTNIKHNRFNYKII